MIVDPAYLWIQVCEQLKWHSKGSDRCIDTLNRLWQKHPEVTTSSGGRLLNVPVLTEDTLTVSMEHWSLDRLAALTRSHTRDQPLSLPPIVILRWFERDFIVDGTTRINFWVRARIVGPHAVLKIMERRP